MVLLDEPSSGLDPVTRRNFWDLIKKVTKDRAIILTTHLMEEADILSDNLAIITEGKLRCYGTPSQMKNLFGGGYNLQVVLANFPGETEHHLVERIAHIMKYFQENIPNI